MNYESAVFKNAAEKFQGVEIPVYVSAYLPGTGPYRMIQFNSSKNGYSFEIIGVDPQDIWDEKKQATTIAPPDIVMEAVSPTNKITAFAVKNTEYKTDIYLKQDGKKELILIVVPQIDKMEWSPDGNYLLVRKVAGSEIGSADIYNMEDKSTIPISFNGGPFWSPDCKKLAISRFGAPIPSK